MIDSEGLLTITECADALGIKYHTFHAWVKKGKIPSVQIEPRKYRLDYDEIFRHPLVVKFCGDRLPPKELSETIELKRTPAQPERTEPLYEAEDFISPVAEEVEEQVPLESAEDDQDDDGSAREVINWLIKRAKAHQDKGEHEAERGLLWAAIELIELTEKS